MSDVRNPDPLALLDRLAPEVDTATAHRAFRDERARRRKRRRLGSAALMAAVSIALVLSAAALKPEPRINVTSDQPPVEADVGSGMFALPAPGEADSELLADGTPIWIVNHGDGSASVLPGMFRASIFESPLDEQLYSTVMWHQGDKFFGVFAHSQVPGRALTWDSYGRSLTGGRDLAGFVAQVDGDRVSVIAADSTEVAGDPLPVSPTSPGPRPEPPQLPPMASIADLRPGWHQLDADILIDEAGNATLCEPLPDDEPIAGLGTSRCPADAPAVDPIDIGELDAMRLMSPLVVHVNDDGTIDAVSANSAGGRFPS